MLSYKIKYSSRKTISIRVLPSQEILVSAPLFTSHTYIDTFVQSKSQWIQKALEKVKYHTSLPKADISKDMKEQALIQILPRVEYYAKLMNLNHTYTTVKITTASTKRGSCSSTGNLMFHRRLSELPVFVLDYVIVHELAHLVHFNHSKEFWNLVEQYCPDYKHTKKRLKENGHHWSIS